MPLAMSRQYIIGVLSLGLGASSVVLRAVERVVDFSIDQSGAGWSAINAYTSTDIPKLKVGSINLNRINSADMPRLTCGDAAGPNVARQIQGLSSAQLQVLLPKQIAALSLQQVAALSAAQLATVVKGPAGTPTTQQRPFLFMLTVGQAGALDPAQLAIMAGNTSYQALLKQLSKVAVQKLNITNCSVDQLSTLGFIPLLSAAQLQTTLSITKKSVLASLAPAQLGALDPDAVASLPIASITPFIGSLNVASYGETQVASLASILSKAQIQSLTKYNRFSNATLSLIMDRLSFDQFATLAGSAGLGQIAQLSVTDLCKIAPDVFSLFKTRANYLSGNVSPANFSGTTIYTADQMARLAWIVSFFDKPRFQSLAPGFIAQLPVAAFNPSATEADFKRAGADGRPAQTWLTDDQIKALTSDQLVALVPLVGASWPTATQIPLFRPCAGLIGFLTKMSDAACKAVTSDQLAACAPAITQDLFNKIKWCAFTSAQLQVIKSNNRTLT